ncbi:MAG: SLC13 family permease [Rhodobacteraceae bacterium]|jgi:di/tricarboxylate transporter|uniref:SLC13 family permease n=1 Tax=Albidovulum sp. TaxID=1872424 RepID=UPI001D44B39A|nr:SLC13 family permease [uncultured Defluviimonas sp.]MCB2125105.1 SLC13 family permease [Paracoccaceae bacterium]MCC0068905.1 SLC13 family permease [Paracoccaceae bacterium]
MTQQQIILFGLFALVFAALVWGRWRYDLIAFSALLAAVVLGVVPAEGAFEGFGHPATLVVALVLIVSAGLTRTGVVMAIARRLLTTDRALAGHIAIMGAVGGLLSAFMNNVAALALLMPVDMETARKAGRAPAMSLMPLSFATILGGMITLIGTPPNIIIASLRQDYLGAPFQMFDFAPVGSVVAVIGILFVALAGWRLIPRQQDAAQAAPPAAYLAELTVGKESRLVGQPMSVLYDEADRTDATVLALIRDRKRRYAVARDRIIEAGDVLLFEAAAEALDEIRSGLRLDFADHRRKTYLTAEKAGFDLAEAVVPATARIRGKTAEAVGLAWRQRSVLLGISRRGQRIRGPVRKTRIRAGDVLLLLTPADTTDQVIEWLGCLPLAGRGLSVTKEERLWPAVGIFAAAVLAASLGLIDLPVALGIVAVGYVATRVLPLVEIYDHVEWPVIVLLGSMIPLGNALESSGGTDLIAAGLVRLSLGAPAWVALLLLMVVTMSLSDVLNNTATAIVAGPVGISMAHSLGASPDPFLMAVAVASSCAFLTPIGHKNNMLILGPGRYRFGDYWPMGLPLELLVIATGLPAILFFWPL